MTLEHLRKYQFKSSGNPKGRPKVVRMLIRKAQKLSPKALELAANILASDGAEFKDNSSVQIAFKKLQLDAAKFIASYGMGSPPRYDESLPDSTARRVVESLSRENLEALARTRLSTETPDGSADEPQH